MQEGMADMLADLEAEQQTVLDLVAGIDADDWLRPTPARGWDVRDTVSHLAHIDEAAADTATGGPQTLNPTAARFASGDDYTLSGCLRGRRLPGAGVRRWYEEASVHVRTVLGSLDPRSRVPWGIGMSVQSLVTARLMETWAHGLDAFAALGVEPVDTDRLHHVAWIGYRALPYAFSVAGRPPPDAPLRVELTSPTGATWTFGPDGAPNLIRGPASQFCRVFVQRLHRSQATDLIADGELAHVALDVARAYL